MSKHLLFGVILVAAGVLFTNAKPASAELLLCNATSRGTLMAVSGYGLGTEVTTHGWSTIRRNTCTSVLPGDLQPNVTFYVYAQDTETTRDRVLVGSRTLCISSSNPFTIAHAQNLKTCTSKGSMQRVPADFATLRSPGNRLRVVIQDSTYAIDERSASDPFP